MIFDCEVRFIYLSYFKPTCKHSNAQTKNAILRILVAWKRKNPLYRTAN